MQVAVEFRVVERFELFLETLTNVNLWKNDLAGMWNVGIVDNAQRHWETHVRNHGISLLMHL
jgi:hypothetical protein